MGKINTTLESRSITCTKAPGSLNSSPCEDLLRYVASWSSQRGPASKLSPPEIRFIKALISGQWWPITPYIINKPFFLVVVVLMGVVRRAMIASVWRSLRGWWYWSPAFCITQTRFDIFRIFRGQQCRFNHNWWLLSHFIIILGPDPSKYLWYTTIFTYAYIDLRMIIYLHICRHVYLYITYTLPCQPVAYHDPFCRKSHQIAPGLTMLKRLGVERHRTQTSGVTTFSWWNLELGSLFSFSATAGSSSCSCWFARAMHNWVSRTWMQLKLLARRFPFFPQS